MKTCSERWSLGLEYVESLPHLSRLGTVREELPSYSHRATILNNYSNKRRPRQTDILLQVLAPDAPHAQGQCTTFLLRFWFSEHCASPIAFR
jgi:hypothetical protein